MHRMRNSILTQQQFEGMNGIDDGRLKSQRQNQEICQRFLRLSCQKMISSRGSANLRRNLLILHLLQKARKDIHQVPAECKCLLASEAPSQTPPVRLSALRRSQSPRAGSPIARKSLLNGRSFQPQQTTPKRWPSAFQPPTAIVAPKKESAPQPTTPPPEEENMKTNNAFALVYQALENNEDDVFVDEEKENNGKEENSDEDVEELFLQKVGKSFISPPISPEKPAQKLFEELKENDRCSMKSKNKLTAGRRLEFPLPDLRNTTGRRDFFGIALPESKPAALSDVFTGQIKSAPIPLHNVDKNEFEETDDDLPPYLFNCDQPKVEVTEKSGSNERVVPTRAYRSSVSLCLDSNDLKQLENEDCCVTDGDYTEDEGENDSADFGPRFPSFKRRLRKRKTIGVARNAAVFFLAEKRPKDAPDLLMLTNVPDERNEEHCVPSISI